MGTRKSKLSNPRPCLSERYAQFCNEFQNAKDEPRYIVDFFGLFKSPPLGKNNKNEDIKVIASCENKDIQKILLELGDKGADVVAINDCIKYPKLHEYELERLTQAMHANIELHPQFNERIRDISRGIKEFNRRVKALRGAIKLVCGLEPIRMEVIDNLGKCHPDFNERLAALQKEFADVVNIYVEYASSFCSKSGKVSGSVASNWAIPISKMQIPQRGTDKNDIPINPAKDSHWNGRIIAIVNELKRIGFSAKQAYQKTMDLFTLAFPKIWKDNDPDLIRQRYTYHTKIKK